MTLAERFRSTSAPRFTGIYVRSFEHDDAIAEIARLCRDQGWSLATWDVDRGLAVAGRADGAGVVPGAPIPWPRSARWPRWPRPRARRCWCCGTSTVPGLRRDRPGARQPARRRQAGPDLRRDPGAGRPGSRSSWRSSSWSSSTTCPASTSSRPSPAAIATEPGELPDGDGLAAVLDAAAGLTRLEAENAFSLSLVRHGRLAPDVLWEIKAGMLKKSGLLTLHRGGETFADLGGLEALKSFCSRALRPGRPSGVRARGVLLLGPPGSGKSAFCKALGCETGRPTLILDVGALLGSLVGQSEANIRQALRLVDAMSPCVVMIDEVEKALAGSSGSAGDSGRLGPAVRHDAVLAQRPDQRLVGNERVKLTHLGAK